MFVRGHKVHNYKDKTFIEKMLISLQKKKSIIDATNKDSKITCFHKWFKKLIVCK